MQQPSKLYLVLSYILIPIALFFGLRKEEVVAEKEETDQIIPIDSLNKLNDSLTKAVLDTAKTKSDSLTTLVWPGGTPFEVPKESIVVAFHAYASDSTVTTPLDLTCTELDFSDKTELLSSPKTYLFKQIASSKTLGKPSYFEERTNKSLLVIYL